MIRRPRLDAEQREEIAFYGLDQLRELYDKTVGGHDAAVRLRNNTVRRDQLRDEIRWRTRREERRFWWTVVAAGAAIIAAVFAVLGYFWPR